LTAATATTTAMLIYESLNIMSCHLLQLILPGLNLNQYNFKVSLVLFCGNFSFIKAVWE